MIEVMKKVTVVCLDNAKEQTAKALQSLGIVHVMDIVPPASQDLDALSKKQADLERILKAVPENLVADGQPRLPAQTITEALENLDEQQKLHEELQNISKELELLEPWGSFDAAMLNDCRSRGLNVVLCSATSFVICFCAASSGIGGIKSSAPHATVTKHNAQLIPNTATFTTKFLITTFLF